MAFDCPHRGGHVGNVMGCVVPIGPMVWASYGSSNIFRHGGRPPFWILKIFNIWYVTVIGVLICCGVPNFIKIGSRIRPPDAHNFWMFNAPLLGNGRCRGNGRCLYSNCALNIQQLRVSGGQTREPILMKFGTPQQIKTSITVTWSNIKILKFKMADGHHVGKCWKCYNTLTDGPIRTKLGLSHPTNASTVIPFPRYWSSLLSAQWTFWFYGV